MTNYLDRTFSFDGTVYRSFSDGIVRSPAFTIASLARSLVREGDPLPLPSGYDEEVLDRICWILGAHEPRVVSMDHAHELAEIGRELLAREGALTISEETEVRHLVNLVDQVEQRMKKS